MLPPVDPNSVTLDEAFDILCPPESLSALFGLSRSEDLGDFGDVTTRVMRPGGVGGDGQATGVLVAREEGVIAGFRAIGSLIDAYDCSLECRVEIRDGRTVKAGQALGRLIGRVDELLALERPVLNVLSHLGGIATQTRACVEAVVDTGCRVFDTRKTVPGWRGLAKYAVRCGGGFCHRIGLYDAVLVKDNHLAGIDEAELTVALNDRLGSARRVAPLKFVEVEVESLAQLERVLGCEAGLIDVILLDNMDMEDYIAAVRLRSELAPKVSLEASGGLSLSMLRDVAQAGVDRVAIGSLTHSVRALDIAMEIEHQG